MAESMAEQNQYVEAWAELCSRLKTKTFINIYMLFQRQSGTRTST